MFIITRILAHGLLWTQVSAHGLQARASPLDKNLTNTVPDDSGPVLYYNGSGNVPGINTSSPEPKPLPSPTTQQISNAIVQRIYAIGTGYFTNISNSLGWAPEPEREFEYDFRAAYDPEGQ